MAIFVSQALKTYYNHPIQLLTGRRFYQRLYLRQEYGHFSVKQSLYGLACHENTKLSDCDSALNDHLIQMHVALMFANSCSTKSCKVMRLILTNPTLENFLQLLVESKFSLWEYFWIIIAGMETDLYLVQ